jgi:hypothetical protein
MIQTLKSKMRGFVFSFTSVISRIFSRCFSSAFKEEYRKFRILLHHFMLRLFNNDILKFENQRRENLVVVMTLFAASGGTISTIILMPYLRSLPGFTSETIWVEKTFFLTLSMAFTGIISVINWDNMFLDQKDYLYLSGLPVSTNTLFTAKFFSLLSFVGLVSLAFHLVPIFTFTFFSAEMYNVDPFYSTSLLKFAVVHMISGFLANLFIFLFVALVQGILMLLFNTYLFKRISMAIQTLLLMGFVSTFIWFPQMAASMPELKEQYTWFVNYFPPLWFTGFYEQLIGFTDYAFTRHLYIAPIAVTLLLDLYVLCIPLTFRRFSKPTSPGKVKGLAAVLMSGLKRGFDSRVLKHPIQKAIFYFTLSTLRRSRKHKLQLAIFTALPITFIVTQLSFLSYSKGLAYFSKISPFLAAIPFIYYIFAAVGIRAIVAHPVCEDANWLFQITEGDHPTHYLRGFKKAVTLVAFLPFFLLNVSFYLYFWGFVPALLHSVFGLVTAFLTLEVLFLNYGKMPFVSSYVPGKANIKGFWALYLGAFLLYVALFTSLGLLLLHNPLFYILYYVVAIDAFIMLRRYRYKRNRGFRFVFDEEPEPAMLSLGFDAGV